MNGPFGFPWSTFGAFLVVAGSIVVSVIWAVTASGRDRTGRGDGDE